MLQLHAVIKYFEEIIITMHNFYDTKSAADTNLSAASACMHILLSNS